MTQEEKELLLKDLSARSPYGVKVQYDNEIYNIDYISALYEEVKLDIPDNYTIGISEIKPYLRHMSSMTEDERIEFENQFGCKLNIDEIWGHSLVWNIGSSDEYIDAEFELVDIDLISTWFDKKMFDWRRIKKGNKRISMIKAGLAIEAPEGMYN